MRESQVNESDVSQLHMNESRMNMRESHMNTRDICEYESVTYE